MTLQSDRAGQAEQTEPVTRHATDRGVDRIAAVLRDAAPGAGWAVGGVDGPEAVVEAATGFRVGAGDGAGAEVGAEFDSGAGERTGADVPAGEPAGGGLRVGERVPAPDLGGLVGVLAVWPVIGMLVDAGELALHTPLTAYGAGDGLPAGITAHHLLTHGSGVSSALVGLAERLCGSPLAGFAADRIWRPLGMTRTGFAADGTLYAPAADLGRFLSHLLAPAGGPVSRAWTAQSLRIRTGELLPARGLLWHPSAHGSWSHGAGRTLWISPRARRWAALLPATPSAPLRTAFRDAVFA
ncbi:hypothetical protein ACFYYB_01360 [Streptomyces sp. NPDC002886]|uniref:hypothetical protein n=1 Tax=Streptomyces sp. NPDC002886 TaxID=3364667 RepID=UPI003692AA06